jgi:hypothetical protein
VDGLLGRWLNWRGRERPMGKAAERFGAYRGGFVLRRRAEMWRGVGFCGAGWGKWNIGGFVVRILLVMARVGSVWRAWAGNGAQGQVVARPRGVGLSVRITGPPCYWGCCAFRTIFAHRSWEKLEWELILRGDGAILLFEGGARGGSWMRIFACIASGAAVEEVSVRETARAFAGPAQRS